MFGIGPLELLIMVAVIALIFGPGAVVLWILTRTAGSPPPAPPVTDTAIAIARQRYASGEIDAAQFAEIARNLGHADPGSDVDTGYPAGDSDTPAEA